MCKNMYRNLILKEQFNDLLKMLETSKQKFSRARIKNPVRLIYIFFCLLLPPPVGHACYYW